MKTSILVLMTFLLFPKLSLSQPKELKNKVIWDENRPLTWKDFNGPVDKKSPYYAITASGIFYQIKQLSQNDLEVNIFCYFNPKKSWKKKKNINEKLLKHEQNHFDITEINSRRLAKELSSLEMNSIKIVVNNIKKIYSNISKENKKMSQEYDKETNHGKNIEQQELWNNKVQSLLADTKDADIRSIKINLIPTQRKN